MCVEDVLPLCCTARTSAVKLPKLRTRSTLLQTDAIMKVTSTCICGSDLHLYLGFVPGMEPGMASVQPDSRLEQ